MKEYIRNEKDLHIAPTWILRLNLLSWVITLALVIIGVIIIILKGFNYFMITLSIPFILIIIWGIISDTLFVYEENLKIQIESSKIKVVYNLNQDMVPTSKNKVEIEIKNIRKTKVGKKSITVYGDILKKAPMRKQVKLRKYKIRISHFGEEQQNLAWDIKAKEQEK